MSEPPADEWQPQNGPDLDDTTEADPADVAEQRQAAPDEDEPKF